MSMYTLLRNNPTPSEEDVEATFEGIYMYMYMYVYMMVVKHKCIVHSQGFC